LRCGLLDKQCSWLREVADDGGVGVVVVAYVLAVADVAVVAAAAVAVGGECQCGGDVVGIEKEEGCQQQK